MGLTPYLLWDQLQLKVTGRSLRTEKLLRSRVIEYSELQGTHSDLQSLTLLARRRWYLTREALLPGLETTHL